MKVSCAELGMKDCEFVAEAENADEVKKMLQDHGMNEHADLLSKLSEKEQQAIADAIDEKLQLQS